MSIAGLSKERLLELGGLKERCSAGMRCVAHGLALPCALCELEGDSGHGFVCDACGQHFKADASAATGRACKSVEAFTDNGTIAFEQDALNKIQEEARQAEVERARQESAAAEERRQRIEREKAAEKEKGKKDPPPVRSWWARFVRFLRWTISILVILFLIVLCTASLDNKQARSPSISPETTKNVAVDEPVLKTPKTVLPAPVAIPVGNSQLTDPSDLFLLDDYRYIKKRLEIISRRGFSVRMLIVTTTGGEAIDLFGRRVRSAWNSAGGESKTDLLITLESANSAIHFDSDPGLKQTLSDEDVGALIVGSFLPETRKFGIAKGTHALVSRLDKMLSAKYYATADEEKISAATESLAATMLESVKVFPGRDRNASTVYSIEQAEIDSAIVQLESMPRPERGDRKVARQLHKQGLDLVGQAGFESLSIDFLQQAHSADPRDVQVVNDLAFAQVTAGHYDDAYKNLLKTLRLAPTRTSAWVNLAEIPYGIDQGHRAAVYCYMLGYYFSKDRAKAIEYIRTKSSAENGSSEIKTVASLALQQIEKMENN